MKNSGVHPAKIPIAPYSAKLTTGIPPEQKLISNVSIKPGKHTFGMAFVREKTGEHGEQIGTTKLCIDGNVVAQRAMRTQPGKFTLSGDGLCVGYDSGDAVSSEYSTPGTFKGGTIMGVGISVGKQEYSDLQKEAARALNRD